MGRTLWISFSLRNAYRINALLYRLRQLPLLGRILPPELYNSRWPRRVAAAVTVLWELVSVFLWKGVYFYFMVFWAASLAAPGEPAAILHIHCMLTAIGAAANTYLFDPKRDKYYAIFLLRMDARQCCLADYGYKMAKLLVGSVPLWLWWGTAAGLPAWMCVLAAVFPAGAKAAVAFWDLRDFAKRGKNPDENKLVVPVLIGGAALLAAAYVPAALGICLPAAAAAAIMGTAILLGLLSVRFIVTYPLYRPMCQQMLFDAIHAGQPAGNAAQPGGKSLDLDPSFTSDGTGFAFLNELFVRRHRRLLWRPALRQASVIAALGAAGTLAALLWPEAAETLGQIPGRALPYTVFLLYFLNRGTGFTRALFLHCDVSLLTYPFCKEPRPLLKLFTLRLRDIVKVNAVPAAVMGLSLAALSAVSGVRDPVHWTVVLVTPVAVSAFFSIHYLALYYLFQPYNEATELKGGTYKLITSGTYFVCLSMANLRMEALTFGGLCLAFCAGYWALACVLVYRLAPKRFRIRR